MRMPPARWEPKASWTSLRFTGVLLRGASIGPFDTAGGQAPGYRIQFMPDGSVPLQFEVQAKGKGGAEMRAGRSLYVKKGRVQTVGGDIRATLGRTAVPDTPDKALWPTIRNRTRAISFGAFREFIEQFAHDTAAQGRLGTLQLKDIELPGRKTEANDKACFAFHGVGAFQMLKAATQTFLLLECGVRIKQETVEGHELFNGEDEAARLGDSVALTVADLTKKLHQYLGNSCQLPYLSRVIAAAFPGLKPGSVFADRVLTANADCPCLIELIWSYWHEEGMLVQAINAVSRRFQNVRAPGADRDPLSHVEIDPLRPLNNLLWGYIQDEQNLLTVRRRAYEYDHHYGLTLYGKAVARAQQPTAGRNSWKGSTTCCT